MVTYERPWECVLLNAARDVNPFLFAYEALWLLAGRDDVAPLAYYCSKMPEFSDDGKTFNGSYGARWRNWRGTVGHSHMGVPLRGEIDQLQIIIDHLQSKPDSRRAVLAMWNVEQDLLKIDTSKDTCCNLDVVFSLREESEVVDTGGFAPWDEPISDVAKTKFLDTTVFNRSNDLVWGLTGANAVQFAFLSSYVAGHLGVDVGIYNQVTCNAHAYLKTWEPELWLSWDEDVRYQRDGIQPFPLIRDPETFDEELPQFVTNFSGQRFPAPTCYREPFLQNVARPMLWAFRCYKDKEDASALGWLEKIEADDWRIAASGWIERRLAKRKEKVHG